MNVCWLWVEGLTSRRSRPGRLLKECATPSLFGPAGRLPSSQCTRVGKDVYLCVCIHLHMLAFAVSWGVITAAA